jgi:hypothetical protein
VSYERASFSALRASASSRSAFFCKIGGSYSLTRAFAGGGG